MAITYIIIIFVCILFEAFFSGSEIAVVSLNRVRLRILAEAKDKKAMRIQRMLKRPDRLLGTTLVGTNLCVVIASSVCTKFLYEGYGVRAEWIATVVLLPLVLIFGEFIPKAVFSQSADKITYALGPVIEFFWKLFRPLVWFINRLVNTLLKKITGRSSAKSKNPFVTREELKYLIKESEAEGEIDTYERSIIYKVFDFGKKKVKDVMNPLDSLVHISDSDNIEYLLKKAKKAGHSRFPIINKSGDFIGLVHILDVVFEEDKRRPIKDFVRPLEFIDTNMDIDNALLRLQSKKQTLALAKDPQDKPIGFFTIEDLLEELVGEI
ncbi:MAG: HlyC/CorC family transporter [Candidatus Omnitrophica bacterium]|nr:HlyC/CorC family transporter [Candidatus Omnitrophota bacterium]